jgi:CheY-like chemotaxis protein
MSDLFFTVKILDSAKKIGLKVECVKNSAVAMSRAKSMPKLAIFDLNCVEADPVGIIREMKADPATRAIPMMAFVSHVQVDLRQRALDSGCDQVIARSAFAQNLAALLAPYAEAAEQDRSRN